MTRIQLILAVLLMGVAGLGLIGSAAFAQDAPQNGADLSKYMIWDGDGYVPDGR
ncbi:MAG: hypothetical protein M3Y56_09315 [Armatimonadota bacterium]|nr:hypothetical protein [Armatimonadota bacterium]